MSVPMGLPADTVSVDPAEGLPRIPFLNTRCRVMWVVCPRLWPRTVARSDATVWYSRALPEPGRAAEGYH